MKPVIGTACFPVRALSATLCASALLGAALPAHAQSIEDRLRSQLRTTTQQLRELQDTQAQSQADRAQVEQQRDKALADLKAAQSELAASKGKPDAQAAMQRELSAEKAAHAQDSQQLAKYRSAYEEQVAALRTRGAEQERQQGALKARAAQLQVCEAKNAQLYDVGQEVLSAYEHVGIGTIFSSREPFAQSARVKYDQIAQGYGDRLYAGKYDPRAPLPAASATVAASAPSAASAP
ncbi:hypothetical protein [Paraburkholderia sp.]|uniref:hypothetical protein n=1 Tax=Paraburkholderia sp. TaxID=1926495 RepID=UPI003D6E0E85